MRERMPADMDNRATMECGNACQQIWTRGLDMHGQRITNGTAKATNSKHASRARSRHGRDCHATSALATSMPRHGDTLTHDTTLENHFL